MKRLAILLLLGATLFGPAFTNLNDRQQIRNVLVIPFSRFEFHTEVKLSIINEANELTGDQFYPLLVSTFTQAFELNSTERVSYKIISEQDLSVISPYLKYDLNPKNGHYTCDMDGLDKKALKEILDKYACEYVLTINWYRILGGKTSYKKKALKKISLYSSHLIDYDLFTREGTSIKYDSRVKMKVPSNSANAKYMGLRLQDLKPEFKKLVNDITIHISGSN